MEKVHPHAGATYRVMPVPQGGFGVEVSIPETHATMVSGFSDETAAMAWVEKHKEQVRAGGALSRNGGRWIRKRLANRDGEGAAG